MVTIDIMFHNLKVRLEALFRMVLNKILPHLFNSYYMWMGVSFLI